MEIYCTRINVPMCGSEQSDMVRRLLAEGLQTSFGLRSLPEISRTPSGRPFFPRFPGLHFSLSHTRTHLLAAVADFPVGVDVESISPARAERLAPRLMDARERRDFSFFELWTLRESLYKLRGDLSLRSARFRREQGEIIPPAPAFCRLYPLETAVAALSAARDHLPETLIMVPEEKIRT